MSVRRGRPSEDEAVLILGGLGLQFGLRLADTKGLKISHGSTTLFSE